MPDYVPAWVTGAGGLIGSYIARLAPEKYLVRALTKQDLDLCDRDAVSDELCVDIPDLIIHSAAISKNPACDADPAMARKVNMETVKTLVDLAGDIPIIFLSTDLVFDGKKGNYTETDHPNPLSVYAETKVQAEQVVLRHPKGAVIRTSLNAGHSPTGDRAFNEEMRAAFAADRTLSLFEDEFRCPIPAEITARAIWEIVGQSGIFHLCGAERLSRYEIGELIAANHPELNPKITRGRLRDYQGSPRPPDTSMDCSKIQARLSFQLPRFSDWARQQPLGSL